MSRFLSTKYSSLVPYTPGEQPKDTKYIKLNTNESPFPPSKKAVRMSAKALKMLQLYPDPECFALREKLSEILDIDKDCLLMTNGSDEILNFAFMAFCDNDTPAVFPDITYGFYSVFAKINCVPYREIPLEEDFSIDITKYFDLKGTIFIANPNAPTGLSLSTSQIEEILVHNKDNVVVIDEAYVDFGGESCVPLTKKYDNLLVTQTFSKSRSMAGARLGFGVGNKELIADLNSVKYSTNPYNINRATNAAGIGVLCDQKYTRDNCKTIIENREYTRNELSKLGFVCTDSKTNFVFASHPEFDAKELYLTLKQNGILVRHFEKDRISQYLRITIGTKKQMDTLINKIKEIIQR